MSTADVTVTSGDTVTFASALANGDEVDIVGYGTFSVASLNADNLDSGTVPDARITGAYTGITNLTMSGDLTVDTSTLYVDSANNRVGVGTVSPNSRLTSASTDGSTGLSIHRTFSGNVSGETTVGGLDFTLTDTATSNQVVSRISPVGSAGTGDAFAGAMRFYTAGTNGSIAERMRIDSLGNLLVGKTAISVASVGVEARADGIFASTRSNGESIRANRTSSDGDIIQLRKDNTTVGAIGARGGDIYMATDDTGIRAYDAQDAIIPVGTDGASRDNAIDLGIGSIRFKNRNLSGGVYLGGTGSGNLLDSYEEGTWTPTLLAATTNPTVTYTSGTAGAYTKIGNTVHVFGRVNTTSVSGGSGNVLIGGLPFATDGTYRNAGAIGYVSQVTNSSGYTTTGLNPDAGASSMRLVQSGSGIGGATVSIGSIGNGFDLTFSHTYRV